MALRDKTFPKENLDLPHPLSFPTENGDTPPPPPSHPETFSIPEKNETLKCSPTEIFGTLGQKVREGKSWYSLPPPLPPPVIHKFFRYPKLTKDLRIPLRKFSAPWDKTSSRENLDLPLPLFHKFFRYRKFSETQHRRVPLPNVTVLWDKQKFAGKTLIPPLLPLTFFDTRVPSISGIKNVRDKRGGI